MTYKIFSILIIAGFYVSNVSAAADKRCLSVTKLKSTPMKSLSELKDRFLKSHNEIRKIYKLAPLRWDPKLAAYAQEWANNLKAKKCQMMHRSQRKYGENLAMNWTSRNLGQGRFDKSPEFAVQNWAKECKDYAHTAHKCAQGKVCGHFTQVAWADSERVGCAVVTCDKNQNMYGQGRVELWVCNYDPPGNWVGEKAF